MARMAPCPFATAAQEWRLPHCDVHPDPQVINYSVDRFHEPLVRAVLDVARPAAPHSDHLPSPLHRWRHPLPPSPMLLMAEWPLWRPRWLSLSSWPSEVQDAVKVFGCGAVAGALSRTATAPLDRVRTVLILQAASRSTVPMRKGMWAQLQRIYATGGWRAFYQGNGTNLLKIAPESAVRFTAFEYLRDHLHMCSIGSSSSVTVCHTTEKFVAGAAAGMLAQFVVYPLEVIKTRLAAAAPGYYTGILDCGRRAVRAGGMRVFYNGLGTSLIGMIPYAGVDLCVYTTLRDSLGPGPSPVALAGCGVVSALAAQVFSFPLGLVRNRLQAQGMSPDRPVLYLGMRDCLRQTFRHGGVRGLYDGLLPTLLKVVPATSLSYVVYEQCRVLLDVKPHK